MVGMYLPGSLCLQLGAEGSPEVLGRELPVLAAPDLGQVLGRFGQGLLVQPLLLHVQVEERQELGTERAKMFLVEYVGKSSICWITLVVCWMPRPRGSPWPRRRPPWRRPPPRCLSRRRRGPGPPSRRPAKRRRQQGSCSRECRTRTPIRLCTGSSRQ